MIGEEDTHVKTISTKKSMPAQKPHKSEQVVSTPPEFIEAVEARLGEDFVWDLAATEENTVAAHYFTEEQNSLIQDWSACYGWLWLNPPFSDIAPWVEKAWNESRQGAKVAMLLPASTDTNWWRDYVDGKAYVTFLNGRITFVGHKHGYPKGLALLLYTPYLKGGSCIWDWN